MIKHVSISALLLVLLSFTAACLPASSSIPVPGRTGTASNIDKPVKKIISLAPSSTEIIYFIGLEDRLVGVTEYCNYPPQASNIAKVGGFSTVDVEKAITLQPDLVLSADIHNKSTTPMLEKLGFRVVTFSPKTMDTVINDITLLAKICEISSQAEPTINDLKKRVQSVATKTGDIKDDLKPGVLVVIWHDPLRVAGKGTLVDDLIRIAGGVNTAGGVSGYANFSIESLITADPKVIIVPTSMGQAGTQLWDGITSDTRLQNVTAVKNKAVYKLDGDLVLRYGPRSITALEQLAAILHPSDFNR